MGNEEDGDFELEMLRQAALNSLKQNRAKKAYSNSKTSSQHHHHRPTATNRNLIEIQTSNDLLDDSELCDEIVIAEGLDVDDSDCDEVIEETILSESSRSNSPTEFSENQASAHNSHLPSDSQSEESQTVPSATDANEQGHESSSDDDALSVASRYSLYEDDPGEEKLPTQRLPISARLGQLATSANSNSGDNNRLSSQNQNQRHRSRTRSKDRLRKSRSPPPGNRGRRRRSRTRSRTRSPPFRRRPRRSRSRSFTREFRRRSPSREREPLPPSRIVDNSRDKSRRKEDSRRPLRTSSTPPPKPSRRDYTSRRRSPSPNRSSREKSTRNTEPQSRSSTTKDNNNKKSSEINSETSPDLRPVCFSGIDPELIEKRRRKFQDQIPVHKVEGKKIRLQSNLREPSGSGGSSRRSRSNEEPDEDNHKQTREVRKNSAVQKSKVLKEGSNSSVVETEKGRSSSDKLDKPKRKEDLPVVKSEDEEPEEHEDLRAKLIKKKLKAQQQGHHVGSGRIFTEALKGTRLISSSSSSSNNNKESSSKQRRLNKRKVSLTFA